MQKTRPVHSAIAGDMLEASDEGDDKESDDDDEAFTLAEIPDESNDRTGP